MLPQEVKDWIDLAFKLGQAGQIYIGYMHDRHHGGRRRHGRGVSQSLSRFQRQQKTALSYEQDIEPNLDQTVLLPPRTWQREVGLADRFEAVKAAARKLGINRIVNKPQKDERVPLGFVASGISYAYLQHALSEMGLSGRLPILKLGMPYPLDDKLVRRVRPSVRSACGHRGTPQLRRAADPGNPRPDCKQRGELNTAVYGKQFPGESARHPSPRAGSILRCSWSG